VLSGGAHMHELRRSRSGPFVEADLVTMLDLVDGIDRWKQEGDESRLREVICPVEEALGLLPKIWIRDSAVDAVCTGAKLAMPGILRLESGIEVGAMVAVLTQKGEAVALMSALASGEQIMEAEHGLAARPVRVLMPRGSYPRMW